MVFQSTVAALLKYEHRREQINVKVSEKEFRYIFNRGIIMADNNFCSGEGGNPCQNNGQCLETGSWGFTCQCPEDYTGERCETRTTPELFWGNQWGNGGILEIQLPKEHDLYFKSWVLQVKKPKPGCIVEFIEVWNGCIDYITSSINGDIYIFQNSFHTQTDKIGIKFERYTSDADKTAACFDENNWSIRLVHTTIHNDGTYYKKDCPNKLPWTPTNTEADNTAMEIVGKDELDNYFLDRITQIHKDTQEGKLGRWQKFNDINLEWIGYDDEAAWMLVWLPADKTIKNFAVTLKFPQYCYVSGVVALMSCALTSPSSQAFPTNGGIIDLVHHYDFTDSPFFAVKMYMDKSDIEKEQTFHNCLIKPDYTIKMVDFFGSLGASECNSFVPPSGNFLQITEEDMSGGSANIEWTGRSWGTTGKELNINLKRLPDSPWGLSVFLPFGCFPKKIKVWHACMIEENSDLASNYLELEQVGWNLQKTYIGMSVTLEESDSSSMAACWKQEDWSVDFVIRGDTERHKYSMSPDECPRQLVNDTLTDTYGYSVEDLKGQATSRLQNKPKKTAVEAIAIPISTLSLGSAWTQRSMDPDGRSLSSGTIGNMVVQQSYKAPNIGELDITTDGVTVELEDNYSANGADGVIVELENVNTGTIDAEYLYANYDYADGYDYQYEYSDIPSIEDTYNGNSPFGSSGTLDDMLGDIKNVLKLKTGLKQEYIVNSTAEAIEIKNLTPGVRYRAKTAFVYGNNKTSMTNEFFLVTPPLDVENLKIDVITHDQVKLRWNRPAGFRDHYMIRYQPAELVDLQEKGQNSFSTGSSVETTMFLNQPSAPIGPPIMFNQFPRIEEEPIIVSGTPIVNPQPAVQPQLGTVNMGALFRNSNITGTSNSYLNNLNSIRKRKRRQLLSQEIKVNSMDTEIIIEDLVPDTNYIFTITAVSHDKPSKGIAQTIATPKNYCSLPENANICQGGPGICYSIFTGAVCKCKTGYSGDGINTCTDIDECALEKSPCNPEKSYCINTEGSYLCKCKPGFEDKDGHCMDVNECLEISCADEYNDKNRKCLNTFGSYKCICDLGLKEDENNGENGKCIDVNECEEQEVKCAENASCQNSFGSHSCECDSGYRGNGRLSCEDVDECSENLHNCANADECQNIKGGYECDCKSGFTKHPLSLECIDINECETVEAQKHCLSQGSYITCINEIGSFSCECREGFTRNRWSPAQECVDINECLLPDVCSFDSSCINTLGSYECRCEPGHEITTNLETGEKQCVDINECESETVKCAGMSICVNLIGTYECQCPPGFEGNGGLGICRDIDECEVDKNICSSSHQPGHGVCINTYGSYKCECANGFEDRVDPITGKTRCADIDECADGKGETYCRVVNSYCHNYDGGFDCRCKNGYIGDPYIACVDEDECHDNTHQCDSRAVCRNIVGGYECDCAIGYTSITVDEKHICVDVNECTDGSHKCSKHAKCQNTDGGYDCICENGYQGDGKTCSDVDECASNDHNCHPAHAYCANIPGSFVCTCKPGFRGDGSYCVDIDECQLSTDDCPKETSTCMNTPGSFRCACKEGYGGPKCEDINECLGANSADICRGKNQKCSNTIGAYVCVCEQGYEMIGGVCLDIDECKIGSNGSETACHRYADCTNTEGSFECKCKPGYLGDGKRCGLYNVCEAGLHDCHEHAVCTTPEIGEYVCTCPGGFLGDGLNCVDINECELAIDSCSEDEECINTVGSFKCVCPDGYKFDDNKNRCVDVNECRELDYDICGEFGTCTNTLGSFSCACPKGFFKKNDTYCEDVDECSQTTARQVKQGTRLIWRKFTTCGQNSFCTNTAGSYTCECFEGFRRANNGTCVDIDECQENQNLCDRNAKCRNSEGSYECTCNLGYAGNGSKCLQSRCQPEQRLAKGLKYKECWFGRCNLECKEGFVRNMTAGGTDAVTCSTKNGKFNQAAMRCKRIDPCSEEGNNNCDPFYGTCTDLPAMNSFKCSCPTGFQIVNQLIDALTGETMQKCVDINECHMKPSKCHINADCVNELGGYSCKCKPGYFGNGNTCTELNECLQRNVCPRSAYCINLKGSYKCKCRPGWTMYENNCVKDNSEEVCKTMDCGTEQRCIINPNSGRPKCICPIGSRVYNRRCLPINECTELSGICGEHSTCVDKDNGYYCKCNQGFYKNLNNTCVESKACTTNVSMDCDIDTTEDCIGIDQRDFKCVCKSGYKKNYQGKCVDIDECQADSEQSSTSMISNVLVQRKQSCPVKANCINTPGSHTCQCPIGYIMENNECQDIDECRIIGSELGHKCPRDSICENTLGSYNCICNEGYEFSSQYNRCMDIDECLPENKHLNKCDDNAYCSNIPGSHLCTCNSGYQGTGIKDITGMNINPGCTDVNECLSMSKNSCHYHATCVNTIGSYNCECKHGYFGDGVESCIENVCITMPKEICHPFAECIPLDTNILLLKQRTTSLTSDQNTDTFRCQCREGYKGDGKTLCEDIDECLETPNACGKFTNCFNKAGSYSCQCKPGYVNRSGMNLKIGSCSLDECSNPSLNDCHEKAKCIDTEEGYNCQCYQGFSGNGKICAEVNECASSEINVCVENAECIDKIGGIDCKCVTGFSGDGYEKCVDIDECAAAENPCKGANTKCVNSIGSYQCQCLTGFKKNLQGLCIDINECANPDSNNCHENANCQNTPGTFICSCKQGFSGNGVNCVDINECAASVSPCSNPAQKCINLPGSYQCGCPQGYKGPNPITNKCVDIDECKDLPKACHQHAICTNLPGSWECKCKPGFQGNAKTWCGDVNECNKQGACPGISKCTNTVGSFKCTCPPGYRGLPHQCRDIDECATVPRKCPAPASCKNLPGSFQCQCPKGYTWNETEKKCLDINECTWMQTKPWNPPCAKTGSICTNTQGGYNCKCQKGYKGDGQTCTDIDECARVPSVCPGKNNLCVNDPGGYHCNKLTCPPSVIADVALVLDGHNQIGPYNIKYVQDFARSILEKLEIAANSTFVSMTTYSAEKVTPLYFLSDTKNPMRGKSGALQAVSRIKNVGYNIRIEKPLSFLLNFSFLPAMGRRTDKPGIAIILVSQKTDSFQSLKFLEPALRRSEQKYPQGKNLNFIAVGVDKAVKDELKIVTGSEDRIVMAGEWKNLADSVDDVLEKLCDITGF